MADEPKVTLSSKPFDAPGNDFIGPHKAEMVTISVSHDATEEDVRRALHQYPAAIESTLQTFREMRSLASVSGILEDHPLRDEYLEALRRTE